MPLIASATRGDLWFLLEYNGSYESKAFEASSIPDEVKDFLKGLQTPELKKRFLLIRQADSNQREGLYFFIAQTTPQNPRLYEYHLQEYTDILEIDLSDLADGQPGDPAHLRQEPLFIVCTNGRRDLCCARYGPELYQAMTEEVEEAVWQSSHIGGHNKAPNNLFFPHGINYGRATPGGIKRLINAYQNGRVGLENYRGRVCFDAPVQAAEHFWRQETGVLDLPGIELLSIDALTESQWRVTVQGADGNHQRQIVVQRHETEVEIPITCTGDKLRSIVSYHRAG